MKLRTLGFIFALGAATAAVGCEIQDEDNVPDVQVEDDVPDVQIEDDVPDVQVEEDVPDVQVEEDAPDANVERGAANDEGSAVTTEAPESERGSGGPAGSGGTGN